MNILRSFTETVVTTPTDTFPISFEYDEKYDAVHVFLNDVAVEDLGYTVSQVNAVTLKVEPAIPEGTVRIERETDIDKMKYIFDAGALFIDQNVDADFRQIVHSQQEVRDGFIKLRGDVLPLVHGLQEALQQAQVASEAAQEAADAAEEAANLIGGAVVRVASIDELLSIQNPQDGWVRHVISYHAGWAVEAVYRGPIGGGLFIYDSSKASLNDGVVIFNGWCRQHNGSLDVTDGGAVPDLNTAQHVELKRVFESCRNNNIKKMTMTTGVYLIGQVGVNLGILFDIWGVPDLDANPMYDFHFDGRGAVIKQIDGVQFGVFNGINKTPFDSIFNNTACQNVIIENLEIDGNNTNAVIGDKYGDHGWQIPNYGIRLISGKRNILKNVRVHHMLLDGVYIGKLSGSNDSRDDILMESVHSEYNGRQGLSVCGVRGLTGIGCKFNYTGQAGIMSAPSAGIDFENELGPISDISFINTEIRGNAGHDVHLFNLMGDFDVSNIQFFGGRVIAEGKTVNPFGAAYECGAIGANPSTAVTFNGTLIGGKILRETGGTTWLLDASRMMTFNDCFITDDKDVSLITLAEPNDPMIVDCGEHSFRFSDCRFRIKDKKIKLGTNSQFIGNTVEAKFTKKLDGDFIDASGAYRFYDNLIYTFDNVAYGNTVNWSAWNNKSNRIVNGDAPNAIKWVQSGGDGYSAGIIAVNNSYNIANAFVSNNSIFEQEYRLQGANLSATYPDAWGSAKFYHAGNGEGTLMAYLTNYNGVVLRRVRAGNVWGDFQPL
ncbi:tail fiber protein [Acinetobacter phage vB_AbaP_B09_Aci08]|uniref:Putative capsular polysaccharide depolymerase n=1 Tax=Acinetobacter phage vB_AbaP_B09_Aci08 TaxID=2315601 RepID=A0A386KEV5_9CAUD|nr:tail fiber protein [Acinetobacter phage vB_AbaP_B09_Aci08]AYD82867.1 putative capsular polysaccharide depolymerase [Acinetobacter phage vB_AbaP_B09_Aci08]